MRGEIFPEQSVKGLADMSPLRSELSLKLASLLEERRVSGGLTLPNILDAIRYIRESLPEK